MILKAGTMLQDRYEILEKIGSGGMSDVYKAKCHKLNRLVAIKVLKAEFTDDANFVSKFKMEAQAAAGLSHPNIVSIYDVVDEGDIHFIVMELVEGITLKSYITKKGRLDDEGGHRHCHPGGPGHCRLPTSSTSSTGISSPRTC